MRRSIGEAHLDAAIGDADGVGADGFVGTRGARAGGEIKLPAVQRTKDFAVLDRAGTQRAAAMRALAINRAEAVAEIEDGDLVAIDLR